MGEKKGAPDVRTPSGRSERNLFLKNTRKPGTNIGPKYENLCVRATLGIPYEYLYAPAAP